MKLDIECIREILLYLETNLKYANDKPYTYKHTTISIRKSVDDINKSKGLDKDLLAYAIEKMCDAHIIEANISRGSHNSIIACDIYDISFYGHQLLEKIRPETIWDKTKNIAQSIGNHSLKFIEDTAQQCAVAATTTFVDNLTNQTNLPI